MEEGETTKMLLVAIGGLIGVGGALLASWLTAHFSDRRARREQRQRLLELIGQRRAISGRTPRGDGEPPPAADDLQKWLEEGRHSADRLAFMTGFLETNNEQFEAQAKELEARLKEEKSLTAKLEALSRDRDRLRLMLSNVGEIRDRHSRITEAAPAEGTDAG